MEAHFAVAIANPQTDDVSVNITRGGKDVVPAFMVTAGQLQLVDLPWVNELKNPSMPSFDGTFTFWSTLVKGGAYKLTSSAPVIVYQFNPKEFKVKGCTDGITGGPCYTYSNDASLLLPSTTLSAHYIAIARESFVLKEALTGVPPLYLKAPGFISIVGAEDAMATVTVKFSANTLAGQNGTPAPFKAGTTGTFTLAQGDVLQLMSDSPMNCPAMGGMDPFTDMYGRMGTYGYCDPTTSDLTGTEITSDHKIAVFGGHDCTFIPYNRWACDHLEEQMIPLESWGKDYIGSHSQRSPLTIPDFWRVVSGTDNNTISFDPASVHAPITLQKGDFAEFPSTANFEATGTGAFQLVQYMAGQSYSGFGTGGTSPGDPAMSLSVPIEQYRDNYLFVTPDTYDLNFVNVTVPAGVDVMLDGMSIDPVKFKAIGGGMWTVARVALAAGTHNISAGKPFGISVYGLATYTSYMYPGGLDVKTINIQ
jgi:hypothetical protein